MTEIDKEDFQYIWDVWVTPLAEDLYKKADPDFSKVCNLKIRDMSKVKEAAGEYFCKRRDELKKYYYGKNFLTRKNKTEEVDPGYLLDFHKLSAILCRTLIEYKFFDFNKEKCYEYANNIDSQNTDWLVKNVLINFRLAFLASVVFLYQSMLFKYDSKKQKIYKTIHQKLKENKKLNLYSPYSTDLKNHESFENCMILDLAKRDLNNRSFDFLMYSTVMYQLEEYNKMLILFSEQSPDSLKQFIEDTDN